MDAKSSSIKKDVVRFRMQITKNRPIALGVGCAWIGRGDRYEDTLDRDLPLLISCYEKGFRYFDTARAYGNSEQTLGELVKRVPRETLFLATKANYPKKTAEGKRDFEAFKSSFYQSFDRLHTDHIDLFQIHDTDHFNCCTETLIPFLEDRKKEGLINYIGMGTLSLNAHENAVRSQRVQSALSFLQYSIIKKSADPLIKVCRSFNAAFINASIFHYGLIKAEDPYSYRNDYNPINMIRNRITTASLQSLCKKNNIPILAAALQYPLLNPDIDMTLIGIGRMDNLESTLSLINVAIAPDQWAALFQVQELQPFMYVQDDLGDYG